MRSKYRRHHRLIFLLLLLSSLEMLNRIAGHSHSHANSCSDGAVCAAATPSPAPDQKLAAKANIGVFYFDGWYSESDNSHFKGLLDDPQWAGRKPLSGWKDDTPEIVSQQLKWAHDDGVSFFLFDWYNLDNGRPHVSASLSLNNALQTYQKLPDHAGVRFALNAVIAPTYAYTAQQWPGLIEEWTTKFFTDPNYERVDGKPFLMIEHLNQFSEMINGFDGATTPLESVNRALDALQAAAKAHGFPGVFIAGGVGDWYGYPTKLTFKNPSLLRDAHVDALTEYNNPWGGGSVNSSGAHPSSVEAKMYEWAWEKLATESPHPYIPTVMDGWDPRPWDEKTKGKVLRWYDRSPEVLEEMVRSAIDTVNAHPKTMRVERTPAPPLVLIEAWNEMGEGSYIVPTVGEGNKYGEAVARAVGAKPVSIAPAKAP